MEPEIQSSFARANKTKKKTLGPIPTRLHYIASFLPLFSKHYVHYYSNDLQLDLFVKLLTCRAVSVIPAYTDDSQRSMRPELPRSHSNIESDDCVMYLYLQRIKYILHSLVQNYHIPVKNHLGIPRQDKPKGLQASVGQTHGPIGLRVIFQ